MLRQAGGGAVFGFPEGDTAFKGRCTKPFYRVKRRDKNHCPEKRKDYIFVLPRKMAMCVMMVG
jgi:hypothetical protein